MAPQCSHITRKRGIYYYRRRIPCRPGREVAISLLTRDYREAQSRAERLDRVFRTESLVQDRKKLAAILRERLRADIEEDEATWLRTPAGEPAYAYWLDEGQNAIRADITATQEWLDGARADARGRHFSGYEEAAEDIVVKYGLSGADLPIIALGLVQAKIAMLRARLRRLRGDGPSIIAGVHGAPFSAPEEASPPVAPANGPALSQILPNALDFLAKEAGWRGQTLAQNSATYRMFLVHCGDRPLQSYGKRDLTSFYDALRSLPALYSKKREWRGLSLAEIIERTKADEGVERITMKTVKRHFSALGRLFTYFKRRGEYVGENPARGFEFPLKGRANAGRGVWPSDKLTALFGSPVFTGCLSKARRSRPGACLIRDARYWLPILGLYHGNRLEEFAQLRREDIRCDGEIWYFDISDEGERQLKNKQSRRRVPIHPRVLKLGFLEYVEKAKEQERSKLIFPLLMPGGPDRKLGYYFTKWFTRYRQAIGLYEKGLDYHSFRHGVTTKLYEADVQEAFIEELTGHEGQGTSRKVYKKQMPLSVLLTAISFVRWPELEGAWGPPSALTEKSPPATGGISGPG
ncbi:MAG TPA: site-specific integrase [Stellaceae bacterium]|jgi:site-specific recombinase XerD|nr:site-specific integrase [Stellaceae bacterium]